MAVHRFYGSAPFYSGLHCFLKPGFKQILTKLKIDRAERIRIDCLGEEGRRYYVKNKDGKEIDFCISRNEAPSLLLEVKWNDNSLSPNFDINQHARACAPLLSSKLRQQAHSEICAPAATQKNK